MGRESTRVCARFSKFATFGCVFVSCERESMGECGECVECSELFVFSIGFNDGVDSSLLDSKGFGNVDCGV